jgi:hypothetical protein
LIALATSVITMGIAGSAFSTPILTYGSANPFNVIYSGSGLSLNDNDTTVTPKDGQGAVQMGDTVAFTGLAETNYTATATSFDASLSGGSFNIGTGLLTGTFSSADLTGAFSSNVGFVQFNGVVFTGGSWLPANFSDTVGTALSTEFNLPSMTNWSDIGNQSGIGAFNGSDATTASGTPLSTPEPASVAAFSLGAIALMLMAAVTRRKNCNQVL